jgi:hypothetical protein
MEGVWFRMSTRLSIPELGVDSIFAPRVSQENVSEEVIQPDDPTNIPEEDLDPDLIEPEDDLDAEDTDDDAEDGGDVKEASVDDEVLPLPEPGAPLLPGHYAGFDVADESTDTLDTADTANTREEPQEDGQDLSLDADPETSMVGSVFLHLLSEHLLYEALHLEEDEARLLHETIHAQAAFQSITIDHDLSDLRFRPRRALAASMRHADNLHAASFELVQ